MANALYSDLLNDILPSLAADPSDPVTEHAIRRAAIEFCANTGAWKHITDPDSVTAGDPEYLLSIPQGADVLAVQNVAIGTETIVPKSLDWLNANFSGWRTDNGTPRYFTQVETTSLLLAPVPASGMEGIVVTLTLIPSQASTGIPKWLFDKYMYDLADGAMAYLMMMPNKPWTDVQSGAFRRSRFETAMANANALAAQGLGRARIRTASYH